MPSREERKYYVWSIMIAGLLGFLINIFANLAYGFFIIGDLSWQKINHFNFLLCLALFIGVIGYLMFFINDYPNAPEFSIVYWKRYQDYFFNKFRLVKILRTMIGIYLLLLLAGLILLLYFIFGQNLGYPIATIMLCAGFILANIKVITRRIHV